MAREVAPFTPVVAVWEDCYAESSAQHESPQSAALSYKPCIRRSHGIYVGRAAKNGRECFIIATDDDRNEESPAAIGAPVFIPSGMLIRFEELQMPQPRKRRRRNS